MNAEERHKRNMRIRHLYLEQDMPVKEIARQCGISLSQAYRIISNSPSKEPKGVRGKGERHPYETKRLAVHMALHEGFTRREVAQKLGLCAPALVSKWVTIARNRGMEALMSKHEQAKAKKKLEEDVKHTLSSKQATDLDKAELLEAIDALQFENAVLKATLDVLKKDPGVDCSALTNAEKMQMIDAIKQDGYSLTRLLTYFRISKSSYFYSKAQAKREDKYAKLRVRIREIFEASAATYGSERIWACLRRGDDVHKPVRVSEKVVRRIMKEEGLAVVYLKKKRRYNSYQGEMQQQRPANLVKRNFHADRPNQLWLTDITQFNFNSFRCYLSPIIDCYDGMVVSYRLSKTPDADCVMGMLEQAISSLKCGEAPVLHSDGGIQYWWPMWQESCEAANITRSMSRKACSPDNSACEGFFGRLKNELFYYRGLENMTFNEFKELVDAYICWYNEDRIKKSLGWMSPVEYRRACGLAA